ncbi:MAG: 3-deoxy-manno-octulosonate-8-phosphatase KdsC [Gammaproteobacteria bacterium]|nr:MAG: 3-deoxy-manno-octulosonate-8-phosphatase KdsC [Gammaproteobacteria bacterium]
MLSDDVISRANKIRLVAFDVDGVLTDGSLFFGDDGQEYKAFNSRDGHGIKMLHNNGFNSAIITGRTSDVVEHRAKNLGIDIIYQGQHDKLLALDDLVKNNDMTLEQIAYVGDDVVDLPVLCKVGLAIAVQDAHPLVVKHCHWQTHHSGGHGAARDVCEMLLEVHGLIQQEWLKYLSI